jgi:hypothetical protein
LLKSIKERFQLNDPKIQECHERLKEVSEEVFLDQCIYHLECYKEITNVRSIRRLSVKKQEIGSDDQELHELTKLDEPTNSSEAEPQVGKTSTRSKSNIYNKQLCIIYQNDGGNSEKSNFLKQEKKCSKLRSLLPRKIFSCA